MSVKSQLIKTIDLIPEEELPVLLAVARRFAAFDIDDIATSDDIYAYEIAMQEYERGEAVDIEDIDWD